VDPILRNRVLAAGGLVAVLGFGLRTSGRAVARSEARISELRSHETTAKAAEHEALSRELSFKSDERYFETRLAEDLGKYGLATMVAADLRGPQGFYDELRAPLTLAPGKSWRSAHFSVTASVEKVKFQQQGAQIAASHSVATVQNVSSVPIAYFADIGAGDGRECRTRGSRMHNAMALLPGERAEVAVCAGTGAVRLEKMLALQITPIGYVWLSRVPPMAVGYDAITSQAHRPNVRAELCTRVPAARIAARIEAGDLAWQDVADFYSRHPCDVFGLPEDYRHAQADLPRLPMAPATGAG
jgi:hypothetical protein